MEVSMEELEKMIDKRLEARMNSGSSPQESHVDHVLSCPDCYKKVIKRTEYDCDSCGSPLGSKETASGLDSCPWCGVNLSELPPHKIER